MITKDSIETAYSFLHQKRNVYIHSTLDWQKDDIEYAIGTTPSWRVALSESIWTSPLNMRSWKLLSVVVSMRFIKTDPEAKFFLDVLKSQRTIS